MCVVGSVSSTGLRACGCLLRVYMWPARGGSAKESAMDISRRFDFDFTSAMGIFFHFMMDEGSGSKVNL